MEEKTIPYFVFESALARSERNTKRLLIALVICIIFEPLAEEFDMSVRQVKNIVYKEGDKILRRIERP